jgi:hypothetical protein
MLVWLRLRVRFQNQDVLKRVSINIKMVLCVVTS